MILARNINSKSESQRSIFWRKIHKISTYKTNFVCTLLPSSQNNIVNFKMSRLTKISVQTFLTKLKDYVVIMLTGKFLSYKKYHDTLLNCFCDIDRPVCYWSIEHDTRSFRPYIVYFCSVLSPVCSYICIMGSYSFKVTLIQSGPTL